MITQIVQPSITRISFRQEKGDPDYGSCMWADFDFDTENYTLKIMSDCGNYSYGWHPTPQTETSFHLCRRLCEGYLLEKLSDRTRLDYEATTKAAISLMEWADLPDGWEQDIEDAIKRCCGEQEMVDEIYTFAKTYGMRLGMNDICECIEKDYSVNSKKIVDVYMKYIVPKIPKEVAGGAPC